MEIFRSILADPKSVYDISYVPDIVYAHRETGDLTLQLLCPAAPKTSPASRPTSSTPRSRSSAGPIPNTCPPRPTPASFR